MGGGVVTVSVDLGSPWDAADQAEAAVPAEIADVVAPQHRDGIVRMIFGNRELASAPVGVGPRPVVGLAGNLDGTETILLKAVIGEPGVGSPLSVMVEGHLAVDGGGARATVTIDVGACRAELDGLVALTPAEAATVIDRLVGTGAIRMTFDGPDDSVELLTRAFAASAVFEPVATGAPWSAVPGLRLPGYDPEGALRLRPDLRADLTLTIDGTLLPWFAAAPLRPSAAAVRRWDLGDARVVVVTVLPTGAPWPADLAGPGVEARIAGGATSRLPLPPVAQEAALRMVATTDWDGTYDYRLVATRPDGARMAGPWSTTRDRLLVVQPTELAPADAPVRS
jgi:hypothetical protein